MIHKDDIDFSYPGECDRCERELDYFGEPGAEPADQLCRRCLRRIYFRSYLIGGATTLVILSVVYAAARFLEWL